MPEIPALKSIEVNGMQMRYAETGEGLPLVMVHGSVTDHRSWTPHWEELGRHYRVLMPDLRSCGTGPWPTDGGDMSVQRHADDIAAFVEAVAGEPVPLVGWSHGGAVSITVAVQHPELVRSLFLYEPSLSSFVTDPDDLNVATESRAKAFAEGMALVEKGEYEEAARRALSGVNGQPDYFEGMPAWAQRMVLDNARTLPLMAVAKPRPDITADDMRALGIPVKIVIGAETIESFKIIGRTAAELLPRGELQIVDGAVHFWPGLEPAAFNRLLLEFLARN